MPRVNTVSTAADVWNHIASGIEREAQLRYDQLLTVLPPATVGVLERLHADRPEDGAVLAVHLADGRGQPEDTVKVLLSASPIWLTRAGGDGWRAVANYALAHDHPELASVAFERAAADQDGSQRAVCLLRRPCRCCMRIGHAPPTCSPGRSGSMAPRSWCRWQRRSSTIRTPTPPRGRSRRISIWRRIRCSKTVWSRRYWPDMPCKQVT